MLFHLQDIIEEEDQKFLDHICKGIPEFDMAYKQGIFAYKSQLSLSDNPYSTITVKYYRWNRGFKHHVQ